MQKYPSHESGANFVVPQLWDYQIAYTEYRLNATGVRVYMEAGLYDGHPVGSPISEGQAWRSRPDVVESLERSLRDHGEIWDELARR